MAPTAWFNVVGFATPISTTPFSHPKSLNRYLSGTCLVHTTRRGSCPSKHECDQSSFTLKQRTQEIGIRKVLGASVAHLLTLLSGDFVKLILIAGVIALPIAYFAIQRWLTNYAFHVKINGWLFVLPMVLILVVALATVSVYTIKAALTNPARSLRQE